MSERTSKERDVVNIDTEYLEITVTKTEMETFLEGRKGKRKIKGAVTSQSVCV